jgi:hypothetical protein
LECSAETLAELTAMSRSRKEEARMVERAQIVLACLDGKKIQQVAIVSLSNGTTFKHVCLAFPKQGSPHRQ